MNVKQLKEILENCPDDMDVLGRDPETGECFKVLKVEKQDISTFGYTWSQYIVVAIEQYFH